MPIALPGIITGIALRSAFSLFDIPFSVWTIVLGHATFCVVVVYNNAAARFRRTSGSLIEASMDLGADGFQTFRHVVLPNIGTALLAGGMLAFALSFDEVIVTTFTGGQQMTLPIWMLEELIRPRQRPVTNVVAMVVVLVTFLPRVTSITAASSELPSSQLAQQLGRQLAVDRVGGAGQSGALSSGVPTIRSSDWLLRTAGIFETWASMTGPPSKMSM